MKLKGRFDLPSLLFYGMSSLMAVVCILCFVNALSWINNPFPGFLIYQPPRVASMNISEWSGVKAGLKLMDKVIEADERPVSGGADVVAIAMEKPPGTPVRYTIESEGKIRQITVPTGIFSLYDFSRVFLTPFVAGIILFCLGFAVYVLKPNVSTSWVFFFACFFESLYMVTAFEIMSTYFLVHLHYLIVPLMMAPLFHFGLIFPEKKALLSRYPILEYLIYLPALILAIVFELSLLTSTQVLTSNWLASILDIRVTTALTRAFTLLCVAGMIALVIHSMVKPSSAMVRQRARVILFGVALAFLPPGMIMAVVHFLKANFPWNFLAFFVLSYPAAIAYSIVRHNLFDADTIIKRTVGYVFMTAIIVAVYILVSISLNVLLGQYEIAQSEAFPVVFTLVIILIFNPLRDRIQKFIDRIFYRLEYDYQETVQRISEKMRSLLNLDQIGKGIMDTALGTIFIDSGRILLLNPEKQVYECLLGVPKGKDSDHPHAANTSAMIYEPLPADDPLLQEIAQRKNQVTLYDIQEDPVFREGKEAYKKSFDRLEATLIVPLIYEDRLSGVLSLGDKKSGKYYRREDINLLKTLANQGAVAIENAKRADQMKKEEAVRANLARYLSPQIVDQIIKKDVQVNLGGDKKIVTVLFSDIRNFTRISETLPPDQLVQLLNEYFTEMAKIIFENQGSLDKFIGDAIVAVFGSLIALENPAQAAVQSAIQMMKALSTANERWTAQYGFAINIGIGINTGEVFLGNIGSPERMEFTVIGDTVNIASRFSGVARPGQILITKETLKCLDSEIDHRELPPVEVKGKTGKLEVYEIIYS